MNVMTCAEKTRLFPVKRVCERAMENVRCWLTTGPIKPYCVWKWWS